MPDYYAPQVTLVRDGITPLYRQIAEQMTLDIRAGTAPAGALVEKEVAMAARLGVSRPTTRQAFQELVDQGLLLRTRGVGTRVAPERIHRPMTPTSLFDDLAATGRRPGSRVLEHSLVPADDGVARALGVVPGTPVVRVRRLRTADDEPLALLTNHLLPTLAPTVEELAERGLYDLLRDRGAEVYVVHQSLGARLASREEAELLDEIEPAAVLTMERIAVDPVGRVVEHGTHVYRADRYSVDSTLHTR